MYDFYFYFPEVGTYRQFPSNISSGNKVIAKSREYEFKVVDKKDASNFERFSDLVLSGDKEAILKFLKTENLFARQLKFHMKYLRAFLSDKKFYDSAIKILRDRRIFGYDLWKYSFKHLDTQAIKELIETETQCYKETGTYFESSLIKCVPEKNEFRYYDFFPMINPRIHKLENEKSAAMLNVDFRDQYKILLTSLIEKESILDEDRLVLITYFLLQERIEEALNIFKVLDPKNFSDKNSHSCALQYDYLCCYFDILVGYESGFKEARRISKKYGDYPIITWRMLFTEIIDQLNEFDGTEDNDSDIDLEDIDKKKENDKKAKKLEPTLDFKIEDMKCNVDYTNIDSLTIKYYIVNPEILFTRAPFFSQNTQTFSYVKPVYQCVEKLPLKSKFFSFDLNKEYANKDVMIEIDCGSKKAFQTYFSCSLKVAVKEKYSEIRVSDTNDSSVPMVYIKVFSKDYNGNIKFFKDGYTDMRGKFEYGYSNSDNLTNIDKLSMLILSDKHGSTIKECKLPVRVVKDADIGYLNERQAQKYMVWGSKNKKASKKK